MKLSILIPAYNAEKYILRCLQSVLAQPKIFKFEIIIINDGSTDRTKDVVENFIKNNRNIRLFNTENQGVYKARNYGLDKVRGEYTWMLDADDYIAEDAFICFKNALDEKKEADVFHLGYCQEIVNNSFVNRLPPGKNLEVINGIEFLDRNDGRLYLWNNIYRTDFLNSNRIHFLARSVSLEDSLFNLQVFSKAERVCLISSIMYSYLMNPYSISRTKNKKHLLAQGQSSINVHLNAKKLRNSFNETTKAYAVLNQRLNHSVLGFFYSLMVEKYPLDYINNIYKIYKEEGLVPVKKKTINLKQLILQKTVNLKSPFLFLCKLYR